MRIGYACLTVGNLDFKYKTLRLDSLDKERFDEVVRHNLNILHEMILYNARNDIRMFRISSDLIPFGSDERMVYPWQNSYTYEFSAIGELAQKYDIRLSMHPGQYSVLNSPNKEVVIRTIRDLEYHCDILELLNTDSSSKIVLHIGGAYGDKTQAVNRFKNVYNDLSHRIKERLIIENDEKIYNIKEVLEIGEQLKIPVVFDNLHHKINPPSDIIKEDVYWIERAAKTWKNKDGTQKIHFSTQDKDKKPGAHSRYISVSDFMDFFVTYKNKFPNNKKDIDIMLEVKDKNLSAIKCNNLLKSYEPKTTNIKYLEKEWALYKYLILSKDPGSYEMIRTLLKDKHSFPVKEFYEIIEKAIEKEDNKGYEVNTLEHIWGYFKNKANKTQKDKFFKLLEKYMVEEDINMQEKMLIKLRKHLYLLSEIYEEKYLKNSLYLSLTK